MKNFMLVLLCILLFSVMPVSAKTSLYYADNFNQYTADSSCGFSGYPNATYAQSSDVFVQTAGAGGNIVTTIGKDRSTALKLTSRTDGNHIVQSSKSVPVSENDTMVFSYEISIVQNPDVFNNALLGCRKDTGASLFNIILENGVYKFKNYSSIGKFAYALNTWYKIVVIHEGTKRTGYIIDEVSNEVLLSETRTGLKANPTEEFVALYLLNIATATKNMEVLIDNVELYKYDADVNPPSIKFSSITDGKTDVLRNTKINLQFDQKVSGTVGIYQNGILLNGIIDKPLGFNTLEISFPQLLNKQTNYTVDLSNLKNTKDLICDSPNITFTTEGLHPLSPVQIASVTAGLPGKATVNFSVNDPHGYPSFDGTIMATVYSGDSMLAMDYYPLSVTTDTMTEMEFDFGIDWKEAYNLKLMLFDTAGDFVPLAVGTVK